MSSWTVRDRPMDVEEWSRFNICFIVQVGHLTPPIRNQFNSKIMALLVMIYAIMFIWTLQSHVLVSYKSFDLSQLILLQV